MINLFISIIVATSELLRLNNYYITSAENKLMLSKFPSKNMKGFANTASGNANAKNSCQSKKQLDLDDFDVQMLSPNFLAAKTLKKPLKESDIHLKKTNPYGTRFQIPQRDQQLQSEIEIKSNKNISSRLVQQKRAQNVQPNYTYIHIPEMNIFPAYRPQRKPATEITQSLQNIQLQFKDKNSIISAMLKKGQLNNKISLQNKSKQIQIKVSKVDQPVPAVQKIGPAQSKLKSLFNKTNGNTSSNRLSVETGQQKKQKSQQVEEQINQSIEQDYGNQSFQKLSGAHESLIKQSIRQSIRESMGASSGIKQSIRDQIPEQSNLNISKSVSKSKQEIKQDIYQSMPKEAIEQQVYEEIFQQASLSDQISKSKTNNKNFRKTKQKQEDKLQLSVSASKGFRTKTKSISHSIKYAEELTHQNQPKNINAKIHQKLQKGDKLAEQTIKQANYFQKLQSKVMAILNKQNITDQKQVQNKNLGLLMNFRIQVNRLITSQNFMSKLRKLTAFLGPSTNSNIGTDISQLEDKLLTNLMDRIHSLKISGVTQGELANLKKQYDEKLERLLKQQEMNLKIDMDRKLHEKDLQLKKMIAELEQKFKTAAPTSFNNNFVKKFNYGDRIEVDSDYSIESDEISWKMDLWQVLPDFEKKKLYEKQGAQVARFLTEALVNEIKNQNLDRSLDISFQFPDQIQKSHGSFEKSDGSIRNRSDDIGFMKPVIDRDQIRKQMSKNPEKVDIFPPLPGVKKNVNVNQDHFLTNINYQNPLKHLEQNQVRDTLSVTQVIKILAKYKNLFLKRKNDLIRKLVKTIQTKPKENQPLSSIIYQIRILNEKEIKKQEEFYIKAYEEEIIMQLVSIYNKNKNRKSTYIEQEMKKMYDRLVVTCQVKAAQSSVGFPKQIIPNQTYMDLKMSQEDKKIKDIVVNQILNVLAAEFAKEMPKKRK